MMAEPPMGNGSKRKSRFSTYSLLSKTRRKLYGRSGNSTTYISDDTSVSSSMTGANMSLPLHIQTPNVSINHMNSSYYQKIMSNSKSRISSADTNSYSGKLASRQQRIQSEGARQVRQTFLVEPPIPAESNNTTEIKYLPSIPHDSPNGDDLLSWMKNLRSKAEATLLKNKSEERKFYADLSAERQRILTEVPIKDDMFEKLGSLLQNNDEKPKPQIIETVPEKLPSPVHHEPFVEEEEMEPIVDETNSPPLDTIAEAIAEEEYEEGYDSTEKYAEEAHDHESEDAEDSDLEIIEIESEANFSPEENDLGENNDVEMASSDEYDEEEFDERYEQAPALDHVSEDYYSSDDQYHQEQEGDHYAQEYQPYMTPYSHAANVENPDSNQSDFESEDEEQAPTERYSADMAYESHEDDIDVEMNNDDEDPQSFHDNGVGNLSYHLSDASSPEEREEESEDDQEEDVEEESVSDIEEQIESQIEELEEGESFIDEELDVDNQQQMFEIDPALIAAAVQQTLGSSESLQDSVHVDDSHDKHEAIPDNEDHLVDANHVQLSDDNLEDGNHLQIEDNELVEDHLQLKDDELINANHLQIKSDDLHSISSRSTSSSDSESEGLDANESIIDPSLAYLLEGSLSKHEEESKVETQSSSVSRNTTPNSEDEESNEEEEIELEVEVSDERNNLENSTKESETTILPSFTSNGSSKESADDQISYQEILESLVSDGGNARLGEILTAKSPSEDINSFGAGSLIATLAKSSDIEPVEEVLNGVDIEQDIISEPVEEAETNHESSVSQSHLFVSDSVEENITVQDNIFEQVEEVTPSFESQTVPHSEFLEKVEDLYESQELAAIDDNLDTVLSNIAEHVEDIINENEEQGEQQSTILTEIESSNSLLEVEKGDIQGEYISESDIGITTTQAISYEDDVDEVEAAIEDPIEQDDAEFKAGEKDYLKVDAEEVAERIDTQSASNVEAKSQSPEHFAEGNIIDENLEQPQETMSPLADEIQFLGVEDEESKLDEPIPTDTRVENDNETASPVHTEVLTESHETESDTDIKNDAIDDALSANDDDGAIYAENVNSESVKTMLETIGNNIVDDVIDVVAAIDKTVDTSEKDDVTVLSEELQESNEVQSLSLSDKEDSVVVPDLVEISPSTSKESDDTGLKRQREDEESEQPQNVKKPKRSFTSFFGRLFKAGAKKSENEMADIPVEEITVIGSHNDSEDFSATSLLAPSTNKINNFNEDVQAIIDSSKIENEALNSEIVTEDSNLENVAEPVVITGHDINTSIGDVKSADIALNMPLQNITTEEEHIEDNKTPVTEINLIDEFKEERAESETIKNTTLEIPSTEVHDESSSSEKKMKKKLTPKPKRKPISAFAAVNKRVTRSTAPVVDEVDSAKLEFDNLESNNQESQHEALNLKEELQIAEPERETADVSDTDSHQLKGDDSNQVLNSEIDNSKEEQVSKKDEEDEVIDKTLHEEDVKQTNGKGKSRSSRVKDRESAKLTASAVHITMRTRSGRYIGANTSMEIANAEEQEKFENRLISEVASGDIKANTSVSDVAQDYNEIGTRRPRLNKLDIIVEEEEDEPKDVSDTSRKRKRGPPKKKNATTRKRGKR